MAITALTIPFPDFVNGTIMEPDEFDTNNAAIKDKINEIITEITTHLEEVITAARLGTNAVVTGNITNGAVTADKLASSLMLENITLQQHRSTIELDHPDLCVSEAKINNDAVTTVKLADGAVDDEKLAGGAVTPIHLSARLNIRLMMGVKYNG